jgi:AcrR family transcriptional regulator
MRRTDIVRKTGRPDPQRAMELDRRVLEVATEMFVTHGFAGTSIERIAVEAGVGKLTVYRRYPSKEVLFFAVVKSLSDVLTQAHVDARKSSPEPLVQLKLSCRALLDVVVQPSTVAIYRILLTEAPRFPDLSIWVQANVMQPTDALIRQLIIAAREAGELRADLDPDAATRALNGTLTGWALKEALLGFGGLADEAERAAFFDYAWDLFLKGERTRS